MTALMRTDLIEIGYMNRGRWRHIADTYADLGLLPRDYSLDGFLYEPNARPDLSSLYLAMGLLASVSALALYIYRINRRLAKALAESLAIQQGENASCRLKSHLERLRRSAHWLGFAFDEPALLERLASQPATGLWRVRVLLAANATLTVEAFPLAGEPEGLRFARIADTVIDSTHPLRHHKTTDRALYDQALQICEAEPDIFDLVFLNERGEVAEGARSNVFVERDGVLLTPPLLSGSSFGKKTDFR